MPSKNEDININVRDIKNKIKESFTTLVNFLLPNCSKTKALETKPPAIAAIKNPRTSGTK